MMECGNKKIENGRLQYASDALGNRIYIYTNNYQYYFVTEINSRNSITSSQKEVSFPEELLVNFSNQRLNEWICNTFKHNNSDLIVDASEKETKEFLKPLINRTYCGAGPVYVKSFGDQEIAVDLLSHFTYLDDNTINYLIENTPQVFRVSNVIMFSKKIKESGGEVYILFDENPSLDEWKEASINSIYIPGGGIKDESTSVRIASWHGGGITFGFSGMAYYSYGTDRMNCGGYSRDYSSRSIVTIGELMSEAKFLGQGFDEVSYIDCCDPTVVLNKTKSIVKEGKLRNFSWIEMEIKQKIKRNQELKNKKILFRRPEEKSNDVRVCYSYNGHESITISRKGNEFTASGFTDGYPNRFAAGGTTVNMPKELIENFDRSTFNQWLKNHLWKDIDTYNAISEKELKKILKKPKEIERVGTVYVEDFGDDLNAKEIMKEFSDIKSDKIEDMIKKTPQLFYVKSYKDFCDFINIFGGKAFALDEINKSMQELKYDILNASCIPGGGYKLYKSVITLIDWPSGSIKFNLDKVFATYKYNTSDGEEEYTRNYLNESIITVGKILSDANDYFKKQIFNENERTDPTIVWRRDYNDEIPWAYNAMLETINGDFEFEKVADEIAGFVPRHHWHSDKTSIFAEVEMKEDKEYEDIWFDCRGLDEKEIFKRIESRIWQDGIESQRLWYVVIESPESIDPDRVRKYTKFRLYKAQFIFLIAKSDKMIKASLNENGEYLSLDENGEFISEKVMDWYEPFEKKDYVTMIQYEGYSHDGSETYYALKTIPVECSNK